MFKKTLFRFAQRRSWAANHLADVAARYLNAWHNLDYDCATNGERELLLRCSDFTTLFDVGANHGDWAKLALTNVPKALIHCFELIPSTFQCLEQELGGNDRCKLNAFGLAETDGEKQAVTYAGHDGISTLIENSNHQFQKITVEVATRRGDSYCDENQINTIDLLKIDVEGAEHLVLDGFKRRISDHKISVIQFEYGRASIQTRFLLKDFYFILNAQGYTVGKLYRNGVAFGEYAESCEDFRGPNFVAVLRSRSDLLDRLKVD